MILSLDIQSILNQSKINHFVVIAQCETARLTELSYIDNIVTRENCKCLKSHLAEVLAKDRTGDTLANNISASNAMIASHFFLDAAAAFARKKAPYPDSSRVPAARAKTACVASSSLAVQR